MCLYCRIYYRNNYNIENKEGNTYPYIKYVCETYIYVKFSFINHIKEDEDYYAEMQIMNQKQKDIFDNDNFFKFIRNLFKDIKDISENVYIEFCNYFNISTGDILYNKNEKTLKQSLNVLLEKIKYLEAVYKKN
jgi:hypothetical protein